MIDVGFNREVAKESALYWNNDFGNLSKIIEISESLSDEERRQLGLKAKERVKEVYSWQYIADLYLNLWTL